MGNPRDMRAFRERQSGAAPGDIAREMRHLFGAAPPPATAGPLPMRCRIVKTLTFGRTQTRRGSNVSRQATVPNRVSGWARDGMPVATVRKPQDMQAFPGRQEARPDEVTDENGDALPRGKRGSPY